MDDNMLESLRSFDGVWSRVTGGETPAAGTPEDLRRLMCGAARLQAQELLGAAEPPGGRGGQYHTQAARGALPAHGRDLHAGSRLCLGPLYAGRPPLGLYGRRGQRGGLHRQRPARPGRDGTAAG